MKKPDQQPMTKSEIIWNGSTTFFYLIIAAGIGLVVDSLDGVASKTQQIHQVLLVTQAINAIYHGALLPFAPASRK